ncbi:MAG: CRISPR-associated protein Cas3 [Thermosipho sp. (in: Bacteria)]|jgi:CRISPR-associated endonuclease/helicase Cas3|nr:CRISPR-associated protein Cas3 [Thermosipho sp. (in: thermotogales)]
MVLNLEKLKSHPDKYLLDHIEGVRENTKKLTDSRFAELVAIFHDLGKINPNFQDKLDTQKISKGYANHAYLSAYVFFCAFCCNRNNIKALKQFLEVDELTQNDLIALNVAIAKHHGNLPDFTPIDYNGIGASILSKDENFSLFEFIEKEQDLPTYDFVNHFIHIEDFRELMFNPKIQQGYSEKIIFDGDKNKSALDFFINYQAVFASVLQADKADAGKIVNFIDEQKNAIQIFSSCFNQKLDSYLIKLNQDTDLNKLRTKIREEAVQNIKIGLKKNEQVFELTAPTGSGKTLMLLSLASEIMNTKGAKRIIYALPFLSITEQIENEVLKIFEGYENFIQRIDSKSENKRFEEIQKELDDNPTKEKISEANILEFQENTFAYPLIITTFVRFFETLLSNKNAELLKLPNFSNCIFLLDEIQSLPPRLYGFFVAYLSHFCKKFGSYAIISTATQPNYELPKENLKVQRFFNKYSEPFPLLPRSYFNDNLFNRYQIEYNEDFIDLNALRDWIIAENQSILVILNTIEDTKDLYKLCKEELNNDEVILLNTHFTPRDRKLKIYLAKRRLREDKKIIVISTQLIEAGVDIDFPIVYRDFATVSSIIQSAGRCNRNGKLPTLGKVKIFQLQNKGKIRSRLIYRGKDNELIRLTKNSFTDTKYQEKDLLNVQKNFFNLIQSDLEWGKHTSISNHNLEFDFLKDITECQYEKIGKFQLIDEKVFGEEKLYYVSKNKKDNSFNRLLKLNDEVMNLIHQNADISFIKLKRKIIELLLRKMSQQIIKVRIKSEDKKPDLADNRSYFDLFHISSSSYSFETGIDLKGNDCIM